MSASRTSRHICSCAQEATALLDAAPTRTHARTAHLPLVGREPAVGLLLAFGQRDPVADAAALVVAVVLHRVQQVLRLEGEVGPAQRTRRHRAQRCRRAMGEVCAFMGALEDEDEHCRAEDRNRAQR